MTERFGNRLAKDIPGSGDAYFDLFGYTNHNLPNISFPVYLSNSGTQGFFLLHDCSLRERPQRDYERRL
jgi:hypothetical protein